MSVLELVDEGTSERTMVHLKADQINLVNKKQLFANSICLIIMTYAQNQDDFEGQVAIGKNITSVVGKVALIVLSGQILDTNNKTKIPFPAMLIESGRQLPRDRNHRYSVVSTKLRYMCPIVGEQTPLVVEENFCPNWVKVPKGKSLRAGAVGPKPYFFR